MDKKIKTTLWIIALISIYVVAIFLIPYWINYENPEKIKSEVKEYLNRKYEIEFVISEPERLGNSWLLYANPRYGQKTDTLVKWKKSATPNITFDSYINDRLRLQAFPEAEQYFKELYGEDTQIFFLFQCMDDQFLKSEEAKTIDFIDEVKQQKLNNYMEVQCYVFKDKRQNRVVVEQDAKRAINEYLDRIASEWQYDVFYLSDKYKDEFSKGFSKDFNFLRINDSDTYIKMHKNGQLLDWFMLMRMKDEPMADVSSGFFFQDE